MVAAVVIGLIVSVIDVLVLLIIYFLVNNSKISNEEKIKLTDKAPFKKLFDFLNIEVKTGKVEYHITSVY